MITVLSRTPQSKVTAREQVIRARVRHAVQIINEGKPSGHIDRQKIEQAISNYVDRPDASSGSIHQATLRSRMQSGKLGVWTPEHKQLAEQLESTLLALCKLVGVEVRERADRPGSVCVEPVRDDLQSNVLPSNVNPRYDFPTPGRPRAVGKGNPHAHEAEEGDGGPYFDAWIERWIERARAAATKRLPKWGHTEFAKEHAAEVAADLLIQCSLPLKVSRQPSNKFLRLAAAISGVRLGIDETTGKLRDQGFFQHCSAVAEKRARYRTREERYRVKRIDPNRTGK